MTNRAERVVFFDLETGGLDPARHPVIQFAGWAFEGKAAREELEVKIRIDPTSCDPEALEMKSYDPDVWKREAVDSREAVQKIDEFMRRHATMPMRSEAGREWFACRLAGYNAATFDRPFLGQLFKSHGEFCVGSLQVLDVLQLAMWWSWTLPADERPENLKLGTVARRLNIEYEDAHDALGDVLATVYVAQELLRRLRKRP